MTCISVAKNTRSIQENLQKLQRDREFLQQVVCDAMSEIATTGTYTSLSSCLKSCHEEKLNMEQTILKSVTVTVEFVYGDRDENNSLTSDISRSKVQIKVYVDRTKCQNKGS